MKDYSELKRIAISAGAGEWTLVIHDDCEYIDGSNGEFIAAFDEPEHGEFIAAANPAEVLELIAEVESLRKEIASLNPFKFDTNKTTIGYTGCVICGQYTNHGGLQCPKLVYHSLSIENQRIVPDEQIRTDHPLESVISKVHNK